MTELLIHIEPELKHQLEDAANRAGLPLDDYVANRIQLVTEREHERDRGSPLPTQELNAGPILPSAPGEDVVDMTLRIFGEITPAELQALPTDLSENHDHSPELESESGHPTDPGESFVDMILRLTSELTPEELAALPTDLSENHDHYIYGIPKRKPE